MQQKIAKLLKEKKKKIMNFDKIINDMQLLQEKVKNYEQKYNKAILYHNQK